MVLKVRGDQHEIAADELPLQRRIVAAEALELVLCRHDASGMVADREWHRIGRHRFAVQTQRFVRDDRAAQPRIVQRHGPRQTIEAVGDTGQAQPLT